MRVIGYNDVQVCLDDDGIGCIKVINEWNEIVLELSFIFRYLLDVAFGGTSCEMMSPSTLFEKLVRTLIFSSLLAEALEGEQIRKSC